MNLLCAKCKKSLAVVFITKLDQSGKRVDEGYCIKCGRELNLISEEMLGNLGGQFGMSPDDLEAASEEMSGLFGDDMDMSQLGAAFAGMMPDMEMDDEDSDGEKKPFGFMSFGGKKDKETENENGKTKKKKNKKEKNERKFLDMYGTNLTAKGRSY